MLQLIKEPDAGRNSSKVPEVQWILITNIINYTTG